MLYSIGWLRPERTDNADNVLDAHWVLMSGPHRSVETANRAAELIYAQAEAGLRYEHYELVDYRIVHSSLLAQYGLALSKYGKQGLPGMDKVR